MALASLFGVATAAVPAEGVLVVDLGTVELSEDAPGRTVPLVVSGGDLVSGLDLLVVVEDGGPELQAFDPSRSGVEVVAGTIFDGLTTDITRPPSRSSRSSCSGSSSSTTRRSARSRS